MDNKRRTLASDTYYTIQLTFHKYIAYSSQKVKSSNRMRIKYHKQK
jgi:hypothetical protein